MDENQMLNYLVETTCDVLGITFNGSTDEEKREFVNKHLEARNQSVNSLLDDAFEEMVQKK